MQAAVAVPRQQPPLWWEPLHPLATALVTRGRLLRAGGYPLRDGRWRLHLTGAALQPATPTGVALQAIMLVAVHPLWSGPWPQPATPL
ncbi:hypothetical protein BHE74_00038709 [Ensete ventricosum]|nr:hypothetical protein BHE74_00038709 [Ensete ventricosum]